MLLLALGGRGTVSAEGAGPRAYVGEEAHESAGQCVLLQPVVHVLTALLASHEARILQHGQMFGDGRLGHCRREPQRDLACRHVGL